VVEELQPDVVVVVGDVNSTVSCALVAAKAGALVAHVEAGLRSRDWGMPEEINRVVTDRLSDYLFATSTSAADNLRDEGYRADQIHVVGNVMVDTLFANHERALQRPILRTLDLSPGSYGLVTLHRPANVDDPEMLGALLTALERVSAELPLVFPVHPRTQLQLSPLRVSHGVRFIDPLGYLDFLALQAQARLVLTDSGGVQEETTVLGVPCLTMRETTERPITVIEGTNQLVGRDPERIVHAVSHVLAEGWPARRPALWDGHAAERIAAVLVHDAPTRRLRPTDRPDLWQPSVTPVVRSSASSL
jgi:UDP-N-acetylglucosamine 2-epimerase (non-hydrolysing)